MSANDAYHRAVRQQLESLAAAGVLNLPKSDALEVPPPSSPQSPPTAAVPSVTDLAASASQQTIEIPRMSDSDVSDAPSLAVLKQEVAACTRCDELAAGRTQTVFGVGDPNARLCFLGEAPGADEDRQGEPFVGRAGQLLNKILEACGLKREEIYILNILKCRPPGNRNPLPTEADNCRRFLDRQLELISPEFVCCLGAVGAQNFLETQTAIGKLRGTVHEARGVKVVCTYHPAYLLRNPSAKKHTWDDMKLLMREMGTPVD